VIIFDVSTLVGAAIRRDSVPELALQHALSRDQVAVSEAMLAELIDVLARPRLARFLDPDLRDDVLSRVHAFGIFFVPTEAVIDCRDAKDNKYLDLARHPRRTVSSAVMEICSCSTLGAACGSCGRPSISPKLRGHPEISDQTRLL